MENSEPKYQQLKDYIKNHIREQHLKAHDPISSEVELTKQFNVSRHTVRKAIGDLVNEGWLYKQQGRGTFVANIQGEAQGQGKLVGVITTYIKDYIFPEIISGIESVLSREGYSIILGNTNNDQDKERKILKNMLQHNLSGLIVEPTKSIYPNQNKDLFEEIISRGVPLLFIHASYQNVKASYIIEDDDKAGYMATKFLIEQGHRRIGGIFKQDDLQGHGRYSGYLKALREYGLERGDQDILWFTTEGISDFSKAISKNRSTPWSQGCTAIVCYNDQMAIELIGKLTQEGMSIPNDLSLVSFDNSELSHAGEVKLTTVAHPKGLLGKKAAGNLIELMSKDKLTVEEIMEPELIIRNSVRQLSETK